VRVAAANSILDRGWGKPSAEGDGASGEIRVIIRQIVEPRGEPRVIDHDDQVTIEHQDGELD
jgi:hypothetical protein